MSVETGQVFTGYEKAQQVCGLIDPGNKDAFYFPIDDALVLPALDFTLGIPP